MFTAGGVRLGAAGSHHHIEEGISVAKNEKTSVRVAAIAAKVLAGGLPTMKEVRTLAASVLTQVADRSLKKA